MKTTSALALLLVAVLAAEAVQAFSPRLPSDLMLMTQTLMARRNDAVCQNSTMSCADCNRFNMCAYVGGGFQYLSTRQCPDSEPYCLEGECVKEAPDCELPAIANDFTCTGDGDEFQGYYPAPYDCTKYYLCSNSVAYVYNCPEDHIYSHARAGCVRRDQSPDSCYTFPCSGVYPQYLLYKPDQAVYAACTPSGPLVSKCRPNYRIDTNDINSPCKPYCARQGRIADEDSDRVYYDCNLVSTAAQANCSSCAAPGTLSDPVKQFCPPAMVYNSLSQRCVTKAVLPTPTP